MRPMKDEDEIVALSSVNCNCVVVRRVNRTAAAILSPYRPFFVRGGGTKQRYLDQRPRWLNYRYQWVKCSLILGLSGLLLSVSGCGALSPRWQLDTDRDGVRDRVDRCVNTDAGVQVATDGCALFFGVLENVVFEQGGSSLNKASRQALDALILKLKSHPDVSLAVDGHTDNRGSAKTNLELSKQRVISVVRYLVINGIDGDRLTPHGYGESRPLVSNATEEGRRQNRRIEIFEKITD